MPIVWRCACGKKLKAPDTAAGKRVGCSGCGAAQTVPSVPEPPPLPAAVVREDAEDDPPPSRPGLPARRPRPRPARRRGIPLALLIGGGAVLLLGCLGAGGFGVYYFAFGGRASEPSPEDELIGEWETDPEPFQAAAAKSPTGALVYFDVQFTFNKDHTFKSNLPFMDEGQWKVVGRDGKRLRVRLTYKVFGLQPDSPPEPAIKVLDHNHIEFDENNLTYQMQWRLRRKGSGPPPGQGPAKPAAPAGPAPAAKKEPAPADGWASYTLDQAVTLELPAKPGNSRAVILFAAGDMLRGTEFPIFGPGMEIHVYLFRQPKAPAKAPRGRSLAESIGAAVLADGATLPIADRRFVQDGKPAALFIRREGKAPGIHLAIGDESLVCLISIAFRTEEDATVKRLFGSVRFGR